jgi:hypothetical protein
MKFVNFRLPGIFERGPHGVYFQGSNGRVLSLLTSTPGCIRIRRQVLQEFVMRPLSAGRRALTFHSKD